MTKEIIPSELNHVIETFKSSLVETKKIVSEVVIRGYHEAGRVIVQYMQMVGIKNMAPIVKAIKDQTGECDRTIRNTVDVYAIVEQEGGLEKYIENNPNITVHKMLNGPKGEHTHNYVMMCLNCHKRKE
jgi:hypothetical protein